MRKKVMLGAATLLMTTLLLSGPGASQEDRIGTTACGTDTARKGPPASSR